MFPPIQIHLISFNTLGSQGCLYAQQVHWGLNEVSVRLLTSGLVYNWECLEGKQNFTRRD